MNISQSGPARPDTLADTDSNHLASTSPPPPPPYIINWLLSNSPAPPVSLRSPNRNFISRGDLVTGVTTGFDFIFPTECLLITKEISRIPSLILNSKNQVDYCKIFDMITSYSNLHCLSTVSRVRHHRNCRVAEQSRSYWQTDRAQYMHFKI